MRIEKAMPFQALIKDYNKPGFTGYSGYFLPFLKKGKKCRPSSRELIGLIAARV
jgi:hypothetical protein